MGNFYGILVLQNHTVEYQTDLTARDKRAFGLFACHPGFPVDPAAAPPDCQEKKVEQPHIENQLPLATAIDRL